MIKVRLDILGVFEIINFDIDFFELSFLKLLVYAENRNTITMLPGLFSS